MDLLHINRILLGTIAVIVIAAAMFMIVVSLLDRPALADESANAPTVPQQPSLDDLFRDFADRITLDRRLRTLEQQTQTLSNTAPTIVPQQPPIADPLQNFTDPIALNPRLQI